MQRRKIEESPRSKLRRKRWGMKGERSREREGGDQDRIMSGYGNGNGYLEKKKNPSSLLDFVIYFSQSLTIGKLRL